MADANAAIVVLASAQGALTVALVAATAYYARRTHDISRATRAQADASAEMAREMREQRLSVSQPLVMASLGRATVHPGQLNVHLELRNVGNGPAIEVRRTVVHQHVCPPEGRQSQRWPVVLAGASEDASFVLMGPLSSDSPAGELEVLWRDVYGRVFGWRYPVEVRGGETPAVELGEGCFLYPEVPATGSEVDHATRDAGGARQDLTGESGGLSI